MLLYGETPAQHKRWLLGQIEDCRSSIVSFTELKLPLEANRIMRTQIKQYFGELVALERYRRTEGLEPDQAYKPPSLIEYEKNIPADELEDYIDHKLELEHLIGVLEDEWHEKELDSRENTGND